MAEDKSFKELIEQSKKTNKLLEQQMASDEKGAKERKDPAKTYFSCLSG